MSWIEVALILFSCLITLFCEGVAHIDGLSLLFHNFCFSSFPFPFSSLYLIFHTFENLSNRKSSSAVYYVFLRSVLIIQYKPQIYHYYYYYLDVSLKSSIQNLTDTLYMTSIRSKHSSDKSLIGS